MNVAELMRQIEKRQGDLSNEKYGRYLDVSGVTLFRWYKGERKPDLRSIRNMAKHFKEIKDKEMLKALADYALFGKEE